MVATVSGSITLPSDPIDGFVSTNSRIAPSISAFQFGTAVAVNYDLYAFESAFPAFGTGGASPSGTETGIADAERFVTNESYLSINPDYQSGTEISGTVTWSGQTFSSLGLTSGTYSRALAADATQTLTIQFGEAPPPNNAVPAPSTLALVLGGLMLSGYPVRRQLGKA